MKTSLYWAAGAGLIFYLGLGVVIVKFVAAMITALVALGSVVFSWAGAALIAEEAGVNIAVIGGLVAALITVLVDQVAQMDSLQNAASSSKFPNGVWPKAVG